MRAKRDGSSSFPRTRTRSAYGLFTFQTAHLVPAARFLRPGFAFVASLTRIRGGGAPRDVRMLARHPLGLHLTRQARRLRRLASHPGDATPRSAFRYGSRTRPE